MHSGAEYVHTHHDAIPRYLSYSFVIQVYHLFEELAKNLHAELRRRENIPGLVELESNNFLRHLKAFALEMKPHRIGPDRRGFGWLLTRNDLPAILNELKSRLGLEPQI
jgi:hypothetical protein